MVDNFDIIKPLLHFDEDGDCYYVQLLRRASDDPKPDGNPDPKYHGNMHSRSIKDYFIRSVEHLDDVADEIRTLCREFNVRAYIRLNRRSYKKIALQMLKHIAEQVSSGESFSSPHHLVSSAAGVVHNEKNKTWLVDIDEEYLPYITDILHMVCKCDPIPARIQNGSPNESNQEFAITHWLKDNVSVIHTKSGRHLIVPPFNKQQFSDLWNRFCFGSGISSMKAPDIHKDNPTILFVP